jgi:hypothetical protein
MHDFLLGSVRDALTKCVAMTTSHDHTLGRAVWPLQGELGVTVESLAGASLGNSGAMGSE